jgi:RND superfamily putative drug exporter
MSRVHAELRPRGSDLVVIDRGSTNGTFVWDEASRAWQRLVAGQPQAVPAGTVLAFGERTATFESAPAGR